MIIHFDYGSTDLEPLFALEAQLESAINSANAGEYDGNEVAVDGSDGRLYMYGSNADYLFEVVEPILKTVDFMRGAKIKKRYGPPQDGIEESLITLNF